MIGIKVSLWVAAILVMMFFITKCFDLISMKNDAMVICGIVGLLILLAFIITIVIWQVKKLIHFIEKKVGDL